MVVQGNYKFHSSHWDGVSLEAKDFVKRLLCYNHKKRLTATEALNHDWIRKAKRPPSMIQNFLEGLLIFLIALVIFFIYFYILSTYFGIEYMFISWLISLVDYNKDLFSWSFSCSLHILQTLEEYIRLEDWRLITRTVNSLLVGDEDGCN